MTSGPTRGWAWAARLRGVVPVGHVALAVVARGGQQLPRRLVVVGVERPRVDDGCRVRASTRESRAGSARGRTVELRAGERHTVLRDV